MAADDEEDLYDDEFDFVDDDDVEDEADEEETAPVAAEKDDYRDDRDDREPDDEPDDAPLDDFGPPKPAANYVVHIYEYKEFKRTIDRPFTPEDAEAFASEYNRTAKPYGRFALAGKDDAKPKKALD